MRSKSCMQAGMALALCLGCGLGHAAQPEYSSKPIRFLVGVVPGVNQTIAAQLTAQATPDGHTILIVPSGHAISPSICRLKYNSVKDFSAVGLVAMVPNVLVVHPAIPARSVKYFIAFARTKLGELNMGSFGTG